MPSLVTGSQVNFSPASLPASCATLISAMQAGQDATGALQACIDGAAVNTVLELPPGVALVSGTIKIARAISITTKNTPAGFSCGVNDAHPCFEMRAVPNTQADNAAGILNITGTGAVVRNLVVNGNRAARLGSATAAECVNPNAGAGRGWNINVNGKEITVEGVTSKNTLCGTALAVEGSRFKMNGNTVAFNGAHQDRYADGMTVLEAKDSEFNSNLFIDNSDVDFIFGGCQNCRIQNNLIRHGDSFSSAAFAAMMIQSWPGRTSGDYTNSDISGNQIDCGPRRRCGFGLYIGGDSWYRDASSTFGGFVHDNIVRNALTGFIIEQVRGGAPMRIRDNMVYSSGGAMRINTDGALSTVNGLAYTIPNATNVIFEDTKISRASYAAVSFRLAVPLWHDMDVPFETVVRGPATAAASDQNALRESVRQLFVNILQREPDAAGLQNYLNAVNNGSLSLELVRQALLQSQEYINLNPTPQFTPLRESIRQLYLYILMREPDIGGLNAFSANIEAGLLSFGQARQSILESTEHRALARQQVTLAYQQILKREPDAGGLAANVNSVIAGQLTLPQVRAALLSSAEYLAMKR